MKKLYLVSVFLILSGFSSNVRANPIIVEYPQVFISELNFDSGNNWTLELMMFRNEMFPQPGSIDSVVIRTNSGRALLLDFPSENYTIFLITPENLNNPLTISSVQDSVRILTYLNESTGYYMYGEYLEHLLVFGYPDCEIPVLFSGQSICSYAFVPQYPVCFYKDNSPTIGYANDTIGATAELRGLFYDYLEHVIPYPMTYYDFSLPDNLASYYRELDGTTYYVPLAVFDFDNEGHYSTHVLAGRRLVGYIYNLEPNNCPYGFITRQSLSCESFQFNTEPGQTLEQDIHLTTTSYVVGLKESPPVPPGSLTVVCSPNPFSSFIDFFLASDNAIIDAEIQLFDTSGKLIKSISINPGASSWTCRVTKETLGKPGIYLYSVSEKGQKVKSGQIICQ